MDAIRRIKKYRTRTKIYDDRVDLRVVRLYAFVPGYSNWYSHGYGRTRTNAVATEVTDPGTQGGKGVPGAEVRIYRGV